MSAPAIEILDTTLRDGSYAVHFGFTIPDTRNLVRRLASAGVKWIEVGHGVGLGAAAAGHGDALHDDCDYIAAAAAVKQQSRIGAFCIPGIATLDLLRSAADAGLDFVRIGTPIDRVADSEPFIVEAKKLGLFVAANYMKSYTRPPEELARAAKLSASFGADLVYVVDSAGGMFPEQVANYVEAARCEVDLPVGFHGHDNLGLGVANSLAAVRSGARFVDGSLQGLGRSAGNAATELLVAALEKAGYATGIRLIDLMDAGQELVVPLLRQSGRNALDIAAGIADFHSSYMHHIQRACSKFGVHPVRLILEYGKVNKEDVEQDELEALANKLSKDENVILSRYAFDQYFGHEQDRKTDS